MHKDEPSLRDHVDRLRSSYVDGGVSIILYAGKMRLETDMAEVTTADDSLVCFVCLLKN